ncbi:MAG: hypothetical protein AAF492_17370, partial [Verrucomicrobiota bacterium]
FGPGHFEFGNARDFEGIIMAKPFPTLMLARPGEVTGPFKERVSRYLLVAPGKFGADSLIEDLDGYRVKLSGTLIYRDDQTMIEVIPESIKPTGEGGAHPGSIDGFGTFTLRGEIVDSKCYLGVMKPGNLKPHRACAVRCISGGIPPVFLIRDTEGSAVYLLLTGPDGEAINEEILDYVADPLEVTGELEKHGEWYVLKADPETFQRL